MPKRTISQETKIRIQRMRALARKNGLSQRDVLIRLAKKYPKRNAEGNAMRVSLARHIKQKRKAIAQKKSGINVRGKSPAKK